MIRAPVDPASAESLLPGSQTTVFLLCPLVVEGQGALWSLLSPHKGHS